MNQITIWCISIAMTVILACSMANPGAQTHKVQAKAVIPAISQIPAVKSPSKDDGEPLSRNLWLEASEKNLQRWFDYYAKAIKGFNSIDFVALDTTQGEEFNQLDLTEIDPALVKYRFPSPNGKMQLDIYAYGKLLLPDKKKSGQFELAAQSLESEVALYGIAANKKLRLLFCGDICQFADAAWLNNDMLLVAGTSREPDQKCHPMLWGIKLSTKSVYRFMHPADVAPQPISFSNTVIIYR